MRQLREIQPPFAAIGNLCFREDIDTLNTAVRVVQTEDGKYALGPIVTAYMFVGGRKLRVSRNLGPYSDDAEYMAALISTELEEMKLRQSAEPRSHGEFDEHLAGDAEDIIQVLNGLQTICTALFPSHPRHFTLHHHDLSRANILVDPATFEVTGIVDWECVGARSHWEDTYPRFLLGPEIEEEVEPLAPGDRDECRAEHWNNWEKMRLRLVFDQELGEARREDNDGGAIRREFRTQLDLVDVWPRRIKNWVKQWTDDDNDDDSFLSVGYNALERVPRA